MEGIRASLETIEDGVARFILYKDDERVRTFLWDSEELPNGVRAGDQFEVEFAGDGIESEVTAVSYSEGLTQQRHEELRIPHVKRLVERGASESRIRDYLERSGASEAEIDHLLEELPQGNVNETR